MTTGIAESLRSTRGCAAGSAATDGLSRICRIDVYFAFMAMIAFSSRNFTKRSSDSDTRMTLMSFFQG
jgi:hypothetical protein